MTDINQTVKLSCHWQTARRVCPVHNSWTVLPDEHGRPSGAGSSSVSWVTSSHLYWYV